MSEITIGGTPVGVHDRVVYPNGGICRVKGVESKEIAGQTWLMLMLEREEDGATVMVPQEKVESIGLRKVASAEAMEALFEFLTSSSADPELDWKVRHRENFEKMAAGGLLDTASVLKGLHALARLRPLPQKERELYDSARHQLVGEISASLGLPMAVAENQIDYALDPPPGSGRQAPEDVPLDIKALRRSAPRPKRPASGEEIEEELEGGEEDEDLLSVVGEEEGLAGEEESEEEGYGEEEEEEEGDIGDESEEEEPAPKRVAKAKTTRTAKPAKSRAAAAKPAARSKPKTASKAASKTATQSTSKAASKAPASAGVDSESVTKSVVETGELPEEAKPAAVAATVGAGAAAVPAESAAKPTRKAPAKKSTTAKKTTAAGKTASEARNTKKATTTAARKKSDTTGKAAPKPATASSRASGKKTTSKSSASRTAAAKATSAKTVAEARSVTSKTTATKGTDE